MHKLVHEQIYSTQCSYYIHGLSCVHFGKLQIIIRLKCQEPVSYDFWRISKQHFPSVAAWSGVYTKFCNWKKFKSHVVESQITLVVCLVMFKSLTEKHRTINHMIIFNDSISKFYQSSIWGSCRGISVF